MTQGDVFHQADTITTSAGSTKDVTIAPTSGTQVMVSELQVGTSNYSNQGWGGVYPYDLVADSPLATVNDGLENAYPGYGRYKERGQVVLTDAKVPIDDEKGVQCHFQNTGCSSEIEHYVVAGIEVK